MKAQVSLLIFVSLWLEPSTAFKHQLFLYGTMNMHAIVSKSRRWHGTHGNYHNFTHTNRITPQVATNIIPQLVCSHCVYTSTCVKQLH